MKTFIIVLILLLAFATLYTLTFFNLTPLQALGQSFVAAFGITFLFSQYKKIKKNG